jgi:hypothetical protein
MSRDRPASRMNCPAAIRKWQEYRYSILQDGTQFVNWSILSLLSVLRLSYVYFLLHPGHIRSRLSAAIPVLNTMTCMDLNALRIAMTATLLLIPMPP